MRSGEAVSSQQGAGQGGAVRVLRGGTWVNLSRIARLSLRNRNNPDFRNFVLGFRLARSIP